MTTLKELRGINDGNQGNNNRAPTKLVHCGPCNLGLRIPRGIPSAMINDQNEPTKCPICNYQVVKMSSGGGYTGNGYHICPKCFSDPPNDHGGAATGGEFRCFQCCHPTCTLASGTKDADVEVFPCPFCAASNTTGKITLRKNSRGFILSCSNYLKSKCEYTIWLPKEATTIAIVDEGANQGNRNNARAVCARCSAPNKVVRRLKFKWKPGSVPPGLGRELEACVLCDETLKSDFRVSIPQLNRVRIRGGQRNGNATRGAIRGRGGGQGGRGRGRGGRQSQSSYSAGRGRGRDFNTGRGRGASRGNSNSTTAGTSNGIVCFRCQQPGHYASNCPNAAQ